MSDRLLEQVKRKCNITWNDEDTNARLTDIITAAIPTLIHKLGIADPEFDFSVPSAENTLFKNYCFYDWEHCLNEFDDNYKNEIAQIRAIHRVKYHKANEVVTDE